MAYFVWQIDILELSTLKRSSEILSRKSRFLGGNAKRNRNFSEFSLDKSKLFNPMDAAALTVACSNYKLRQLRVVMRSLSHDAVAQSPIGFNRTSLPGSSICCPPYWSYPQI